MIDRPGLTSADLQPPSCRMVEDGSLYRIQIEGDWVLRGIEAAYKAIETVRVPNGSELAIAIDLSQLSGVDTAGALVLCRLKKRLEQAGRARFALASKDQLILLGEVERAANAKQEAAPQSGGFMMVADRLTSATTAMGRDILRLTDFLGQFSLALVRVLGKLKRFRGTAFVNQIQQTGLSAVPIIALVCFLIGGVVMQQAAQQLRAFGAETLAIDMLGILALREVGVVLTAVMVAGRSASAFTAQIGTMKMREEIDAMRTIGIDPIETLVVPRILALIVVLPLLVFIADVAALSGGAVMAKFYLGLDTPIYLQRLNAVLSVKHFVVGMFKAPFVALIIGLVGCLEGMSVEGSAESLGSQVTSAVVKAIFLVLVLDGVFAIFLSASGF